MPVTVYYDGVMTLSMPGQANASHIVLPEISGMVSDRTEEGFTLTDADGMVYEIKFAEDTLISEEMLPVEEVIEEEIVEEEMTEEGAEVTAEAEETEEITEEPVAEEEAVMDDAGTEEILLPAAELLSESTIEWADGDTVTVYYNGIMSRSIPAQITAMEIVVIR